LFDLQRLSMLGDRLVTVIHKRSRQRANRLSLRSRGNGQTATLTSPLGWRFAHHFLITQAADATQKIPTTAKMIRRELDSAN
jgi:hypothetical protein